MDPHRGDDDIHDRDEERRARSNRHLALDRTSEGRPSVGRGVDRGACTERPLGSVRPSRRSGRADRIRWPRGRDVSSAVHDADLDRGPDLSAGRKPASTRNLVGLPAGPLEVTTWPNPHDAGIVAGCPSPGPFGMDGRSSSSARHWRQVVSRDHVGQPVGLRERQLVLLPKRRDGGRVRRANRSHVGEFAEEPLEPSR